MDMDRLVSKNFSQKVKVETSMKSLRVLELYSGIGGMHCACKESGLPFTVVAAIDVNTTANKIYLHNFPGTNLMDCGIESLTVKQLDTMKIDMILMSPPCQPFTRVGKKQDTEDIRTNSFLHLLGLLPKLQHCPSYVLVENVKGFEKSETRNRLVETLEMCEFTFQECMLTPLQFGIPNSRLRYYLIAKRKPLQFSFPVSDELMTSLPSCAMKWLKYRHKIKSLSKCVGGETDNHSNSQSEIKETNSCISNSLDDQSKSSEQIQKGTLETTSKDENSLVDKEITCSICGIDCLQNYGHNMRQEELDSETSDKECSPLNYFLEDIPQLKLDTYLLPRKDLKRFIVMDIVTPCMCKSTCFTKRYGHFMEGAGSVVQMSTEVETMQIASQLKDEVQELRNRDQWGNREYQILEKLKLRYFTPKEIANLLCFPDEFSFPEMNRIQLYRCLGNSLNVHVVSILLLLLTSGDDFC